MPESISVVIPTYNREKEVLHAIASILAQTHPVDEIIVVDDGSTDNTEEALTRLGDRIRYFRIKNQGASAARNFGWRIATHDWITFLDSDDQWHPEKIQCQLEALKKFPHCQCLLTGALDDEGERLDDLLKMHPSLEESGSMEIPPSDAQFFLFPRHPFLQSLMVKKEALAAAGGMDQSLRVAEDTKLLYRLVTTHGYAAIGRPLVTIQRTRETAGLSNQMDSQTALIRYACYTRVQNEFYWLLLTSAPEAAAKIRRNMAYFVSRWAELACVNKDYRLARQLAREGLALPQKPVGKIRCWLAYLAPSFLAKKCASKWA